MDEVDVVVAGSGAAGMTAALTAAHLGLSALVIEKAGSFGGSTARSGGGIWAPGNSVLRNAGVAETPEQARAYLAHVAEGVPAARREALLEHGPEMLGLVLAKTPVRFAWVPGYADYYPEAPGGLSAGRSIEPVPIDGRRMLGEELAHLARPYLPSPVAITQAEYRWLSLGRHPRGVRAAVRVAARAARARLRGQRILSMGQALAAGLRAGLVAGGVPVWLDTPLAGLEVQDGRVTGVRAIRDGEPVLIRARRGVLIATGGFERDEQMRRRYQRAPIGTEWTTGAEDFGRGDSAYDRYYGDPRLANPNLAPLARPPYYAVKIVPGDLGTKGGLRTDEMARVLRPDGTVIEGLFAAGNASEAVMGRSYAGAGATIGPAMTFGYIAARTMAAEPARSDAG